MAQNSFLVDDFGLVPDGNGAAYLTDANLNLIWYSDGVPGSALKGVCDVAGPTDVFVGRHPGDSDD